MQPYSLFILGAFIRTSAQVPASHSQSICSGASGGLIRLKANKVSYLNPIFDSANRDMFTYK